MENKISKELFDHLVLLAALELEEEEAEYLRAELNKQLTAVEQLVTIPVGDETEIAAHGIAYTDQNSALLREDVHKPFENVAGILASAPQTEEDYFMVPQIPQEDLE